MSKFSYLFKVNNEPKGLKQIHEGKQFLKRIAPSWKVKLRGGGYNHLAVSEGKSWKYFATGTALKYASSIRFYCLNENNEHVTPEDIEKRVQNIKDNKWVTKFLKENNHE